ncbi:MAG: Bax inhibitor-1/YccA family protein [Puniceicoccales bacterium]|jgi:uncharacterized YccA/Bax inhibitor family protein|nr:Bax inhibitor-1/YccA family protein [Puniceicoccales bacterium]
MSYDSSNPILSSRSFSCAESGSVATLSETINRCLILLALVFGAAIFSWVSPGTTLSAVSSKLTLFLILGFVTGFVTCIKKEWAGITAPLYAIFEGLVLGAVSRLFDFAYRGIAFQAIALTFGVAFGMLVLYRSGIIQVSDRFRMIVGSAMFGIAMLYMVSWILSFFGISVPLMHSSGLFGILFSVFVVVIASLYLAIDFDFIVKVSDRGMPAYMSWYAAFGLMVTLIWLYLELLRLLAKFRDR